MKVLITGKGGQLAWELEQSVPQNYQVLSLDQQELDITDPEEVKRTIIEYKPDVVINAAAYTAVDKAEGEQEKSFSVNELGARHLALACQQMGSRLLHVSTDFVFDGSKSMPYQVDDTPNPLNVYGASKLAGDLAIGEVLPEQSVVVRTAWVYSAHGNNFVKTMLKLMAQKAEQADAELGIVSDQVGSPTWAKGLAGWLWAVVGKPKIHGTYHWTDAGIASWYDFAVAIQELAVEKGMLPRAIRIRPIPAKAYPAPAKRPAFSVMDKTKAELAVSIGTVHWRQQLSRMLDELASFEH